MVPWDVAYTHTHTVYYFSIASHVKQSQKQMNRSACTCNVEYLPLLFCSHTLGLIIRETWKVKRFPGFVLNCLIKHMKICHFVSRWIFNCVSLNGDSEQLLLTFPQWEMRCNKCKSDKGQVTRWIGCKNRNHNSVLWWFHFIYLLSSCSVITEMRKNESLICSFKHKKY